MAGEAKIADYVKNLHGQGERDGNSSGGRRPIDFAQLFRAQVEQHDDKKKEDHDRAGVDKDLNDADEISIERHEERGQSEKGHNQTQRTRNRIAVDHDGGPEGQHQDGEEPKEECGHGILMEYWSNGVMD